MAYFYTGGSGTAPTPRTSWNCSKLSWLGVACLLFSRYRLETRKAVGLPGLARPRRPMSAPAYFISRGMVRRCTSTHGVVLSEAILWVKGKHNFEWQFAVPTASVVFSLNRAWPCFCLLQAADVLHGTLHTPGRAHDGVGLAAVSRDLLSSAKARDEVKRR